MTGSLKGFTRIARVQDVPPGETRTFAVGAESVALCNIDGKFYAINNMYTHVDDPLDPEDIDGADVVRLLQALTPNVRDRRAGAQPAAQGIDMFETRVRGENVYIKLDV